MIQQNNEQFRKQKEWVNVAWDGGHDDFTNKHNLLSMCSFDF